MFELKQLEQLVTIADEGTLSKAAKILLVSQPALTRSIQKLEDELQIQLFDRKKNKIILNDNGKLAVKYSKQILNEAKNMSKNLQSHDRNNRIISIGSCAPAPIWGLIYLYNRLYPGIKVIDEIHSNDDKLISGLNNHQYSIIILNHPLNGENLVCLNLVEEDLYLSMPPSHPLALLKEISFNDLDGESILLLSKIGFWNELCLKNLPNSHLLIQEDVSIFHELIKASALPNFKTNITIKREKTKGNRVCIPIKDKEAHIKYYAIFRKEKNKLFNLSQDDINNIVWENI